MKIISTQVFDEFAAHNLSGFTRKSMVKKYLAPQDSPSIQRRIRVDPWPEGGTEFTLTVVLLMTPNPSPKLVLSIQLNLCKQDTSL
jgi:hypothetical protein